ncbi:MAG: hypothetical protein ACK4SX_09425 [Alcanivoracaceae bacterium]
MSGAPEQINKQLLALTESYANAALGPAEYRRQRRLLICQWTGQMVPETGPDRDSEDDTAPKLKAITETDIAMATWAPTEATAPPAKAPWHRRPAVWITLLLLLVALIGAAGLAWFVMR